MPTIVGIFIFIRRENFMLSWIKHEKRFIISKPEQKEPQVVPRSVQPQTAKVKLLVYE